MSREQELLEALHSARLARMALTNAIRNRNALVYVGRSTFDRVLNAESNLDGLIADLEKEIGFIEPDKAKLYYAGQSLRESLCASAAIDYSQSQQFCEAIDKWDSVVKETCKGIAE